MSRQSFIACEKCTRLVRVDDGSYMTSKGVCTHLDADKRYHNCESSMTVFRMRDGRISVPWHPDAPTPEGGVRVEVRGAHNVRKLEREMDAHDLKRHRKHKESYDRVFGPELAARRENLKEIARSHPHQFGRDLAKAALERQQQGYSSTYDPGNHRSE